MANSKLHVRKGDMVVVLSGKDKGKKGKVMLANPSAGKVTVEGVNIVKRHVRAKKQTDQAGIIASEAPIYASNVMHICGKCNKPTRLAHKILDNGDKTRICKHCGEVFNN